MNTKKYLFSLLIITAVMSVFAKNKDPNMYALMTARDLSNNTVSNISIANGTNQSVTASGLFIASYDTADSVTGCSVCTGSIIAGDNLGGAMISPVTFKAGQSIPIGQNYLYNMIYNGIYYIKQNVGSPPCSLPGCTWPNPPDTTGFKWCLSINVTSRDASYTYSNYTNGSSPPAKIPAYSAAGNSPPSQFDYQYDLIDPATLAIGNACLGPITCNDQTLTCKVDSAQSETFQAY